MKSMGFLKIQKVLIKLIKQESEFLLIRLLFLFHLTPHLFSVSFGIADLTISLVDGING